MPQMRTPFRPTAGVADLSEPSLTKRSQPLVPGPPPALQYAASEVSGISSANVAKQALPMITAFARSILAACSVLALVAGAMQARRLRNEFLASTKVQVVTDYFCNAFLGSPFPRASAFLRAQCTLLRVGIQVACSSFRRCAPESFCVFDRACQGPRRNSWPRLKEHSRLTSARSPPSA